MNKIRDFFYNCSDILTAILILGIAAFLIWTRVNVIMAYPDSYDGPGANLIPSFLSDDSQNDDGFISNRDLNSTDSAIQPQSSDSENAPDVSGEVNPGSGETNGNSGEANNGGDAYDPVTPPIAPTRITVGIPQNATAEQVGNILYSSGLISDLNEFYALVEANQITQFVSGSLSIESDSTLEQVVSAVSQ